MCPPQRCSLAEPRRHRERAAGGSLPSHAAMLRTVDDDVASTAHDPRELLEIVHEALVPVELLRADRGPGHAGSVHPRSHRVLPCESLEVVSGSCSYTSGDWQELTLLPPRAYVF